MLRITRIKPNPAGKDRSMGEPKPEQLAAEWVDFKNINTTKVHVDGVKLMHRAFTGPFGQSSMEVVMSFKGTIEPGQVVRVHAGNEHTLYGEDKLGADVHLFTGKKKFVWNNKQGDQPTLMSAQGVLDRTFYDPNPPEGAILTRVGEKLVVSIARAA